MPLPKWGKGGVTEIVARSLPLTREPAAVVRRRKIERRTERHDPSRVHVALAGVIMPLDLIHVHRRGDAFLLIEGAQVIGEIRIIDDAAQVAFEVAVVDRVKANERGE